MARAKKPSEMENMRAENPVTMLEVKFATVRQKLPAEYEKAITGAGRVLASRIKKLDTLNGRLAKARERLAKAREQQKIKATAAVQARFEKARLAVAELKVESADLRAEIVGLRKEISNLKKRSRQFQTIEKAIQKLEKKAAKPHKPRRRKKTKASDRKIALESQWERFTAGSSLNKESAFAEHEIEAEVE